ncbi:MAG: hypothetical protein U1E66_00335 [Rhodospirillales bacterium]
MAGDTVVTPATLATDPASAAAAPTMPPEPRDPYPGLRPFRSDESDIFFGRETQTDEMVQRLKTSRFLAVVGTSGCGKSSLVRAGLVAALETGLMGVPEGARWRFAVMRPGGRPMHRLAAKLSAQVGLAPDGASSSSAIGRGLLGARLRRGPLGIVEVLTANPLPPKTNLLVVVDQFEEIFRFRREGDINEADAFIALLLASAEQEQFPVYVVLTMRSDFIGDCALFEGLPEAINESQYLTPRLSREQRRLAILGPARAFDGDVSESLLNLLLNETNGGPDQLPVLQHLLMRMWTSKARALSPGQRIELDLDDYDRVGGLLHALDRHADEIYQGLANDTQRMIAEVMFRRLSESPANIRRPTEAREIARLAAVPLADVAAVADAFRAPGANFLMPDPSEMVEDRTKLDISHESLIKRWQRLRTWSSNEAHDAEAYRELEREAQKNRRDESDLLSGLNLQRAVAWRQQRDPTADWANRYGGDFALAMRFLSRSEDAAERVRTARKRARRRQLWMWRSFAGVFFLLFVLTVMFFSVAMNTQQAASEAEARVIASQARFALESGDSRIAILAALDALPAQRRPDLADFIRWPFDPHKMPPLRAASARLLDSPFDRWSYGALWTAMWDTVRSPVDKRFYRAVWRFLPIGQPHTQEAAVDALERGVARPLGRIFGSLDDTAPVTALAVSAATKMLVSANEKGVIQRWQWTDEAGWKALEPIVHPALLREKAKPAPQRVLGAAFSADGRLLATITDWNQATIWDTASGKPLIVWTANRKGAPPLLQSNVSTIAFTADPDHPGRQLILTASYVMEAIIWGWDETAPDRPPNALVPLEDTSLAREPNGQRSHRFGVTTLAFSADGRRAVTGSWDGTAKVWDVATGDLLYILDSGSPVRSARFSPRDSGRLVTAGNDGSLRLWCTHAGAAAAAEAAAEAGGLGSEQRPPTPCLRSSDPDASNRDTLSGSATPEPGAPGRPRPRPRPEPPVVLTASSWDTLDRHNREAISVAFDPSGELIASAGLDGTVRLWDATSGEMLDVLQGPAKVSGRYAFVAFLEGESLAASFSDGRAFLWTLAARPLRPEKLPTVPGMHTGAIDVADRRLVTVGTANRIQVWNLGGAGGRTAVIRELRPGGDAPIANIAFSPDGGRLLTISANTVAVWDANVWNATGNDAPLVSLDHSAPVTSFAFDADGQRLATGAADGMVRVWDVRSGKPMADPLRHDAPVTAVVFDDTGQHLMTAAGDTVRIWDRSGTVKRTLVHTARVVGAGFDPAGDRVATVTEDGFVRSWRIGDGSVVNTIGGLPVATEGEPAKPVIAVHAHGDTIDILRTTAGGVPQAWTWNIDANTLESDDAWWINARHRVRVRPNGSIDLIGDGDLPLALLPPPRQPLSGIVVSPDGGYLAAFYANGEMRGVRIPATNADEFIRYAREKVVPLLDRPALSEEERRRLGLGT